MDYFITNIDSIVALENDRLLIWFIDGSKVETTQIDFNHIDNTFELGYIYKQ